MTTSPSPDIELEPPASRAEPKRLPAALVVLISVCCAASVANVYYAQPLLDAISNDFHISRSDVGGVITATQAGCALSLMFVVPLGDLIHRRRLIVCQLVLLAIACVGVAVSESQWALLAAMLGVGLFGTAMTQGLIACAAALAGESERGRVVGTAQGGVVVGLLIARSLAGVVADLAGWRAVYIASATFAAGMLIVLMLFLPAPQAAPVRLTYTGLLRSMIELLLRDRVLRIRGFIALLMFATLSIFWSALVLPLSAPPYAMSHTRIGAFGLVGALGAMAAARAGRLADRGHGQTTTCVALVLLCGCWLPISFIDQSVVLLIVGIVLLDVGGQAIHVVNQSMILSTRPDAQARLVGCYMLFYAAGSGLGAIFSTLAYARAGWPGVCVLGFVVSVAALVFWVVTVRRTPK